MLYHDCNDLSCVVKKSKLKAYLTVQSVAVVSAPQFSQTSTKHAPEQPKPNRLVTLSSTLRTGDRIFTNHVM